MKYIIMAGGQYPNWQTPRQLLPIRGEPIVARTIRLLKEAGATEIFISSHDSQFEKFAPVLYHTNRFIGYTEGGGHWVEAFYPTPDPACYLMGDVVFSPQAIKTIVEKQTESIDFFASAPPFSPYYSKPYAEPFSFKVADQQAFTEAIEFVKANARLFYRRPIAWELWQVIKGTRLNWIDYGNYTAVNDYTCDVDRPEDIYRIERAMDDYDRDQAGRGAGR